MLQKKKSSDNDKGNLNENNPSHRWETAKQNSYLDENQNTECPIKIGTTLEKGNNTNQKNVDYFISLFYELVSNGPVYVCSCCDQLKCPFTLEHLTLADWAAWYDSSGKPFIKKSFQMTLITFPLKQQVKTMMMTFVMNLVMKRRTKKDQ